MMFNLYDSFHATAKRQGDHPALLGPGDDDAWSYAALDEAIPNAAGCLEQAGGRARDCVGLHLPSGADYIIATYALWCSGACVVPLPAELAPPEKAQILRTVALDAVLTPENAAAFLNP